MQNTPQEEREDLVENIAVLMKMLAMWRVLFLAYFIVFVVGGSFFGFYADFLILYSYFVLALPHFFNHSKFLEFSVALINFMLIAYIYSSWNFFSLHIKWLKNLDLHLSNSDSSEQLNLEMQNIQNKIRRHLFSYLLFILPISPAIATTLDDFEYEPFSIVLIVISAAFFILMQCLQKFMLYANQRLDGQEVNLKKSAQKLIFGLLLLVIFSLCNILFNIAEVNGSGLSGGLVNIFVSAFFYGFLCCICFFTAKVALGTAKVLDEKTVH